MFSLIVFIRKTVVVGLFRFCLVLVLFFLFDFVIFRHCDLFLIFVFSILLFLILFLFFVETLDALFGHEILCRLLGA